MAEDWTPVVAVVKLPKGWVRLFYENENIGSAKTGADPQIQTL
jgi:hypothetical protein